MADSKQQQPSKQLQLYLYIRRRRARRDLQVLLLHHIIMENAYSRTVWVKPRSQSFFYETMTNHWNEEYWVKNIRMSKEAFNFLCDELRPYISKEDTTFRKCIPVDIKVASTLYFLSGASDYRTIANLFGLGRSTVCSIVNTVCEQIASRFIKKYIYLPTRNETREIMKQFEKVSGFPQAVAALDGCHIRIKAPNKNLKYFFRDVFVGWTGKSHDARIFKNSPLYKECQNRSFLPINMSKQIGNVEVAPLILGDSAYPLENWLMKPYSDRGNLNPDEVNFNFALSGIRVVVENAFGRLKGRFQCIAKRIDTSLEHTINIVTTCCILHNFCILSNQRFLHEWLEQTQVDLVRNGNNIRCVEAANEAELIRSAIRDHLARRQLARRQ